MRKPDKPIFESLSDDQLLGLCIEREAGGEPLDGKIAVGTVILERVDHRKWDGDTIHEVILWPWQFSWTMPEAGEAYYEAAVKIAANWDEAYKNNTSLQVCYGIAVGMLKGEIPRDPDLAAVHCCQYLNPRVAAKTKKEWLKKGMTVIKKIGKHEFFKEA
jgi:spore germination cell wall hydrolase CwlJ-like protein